MFFCKSAGQSGHLCILGKNSLSFQERRVGHQCHHLGKLDGKADFQYFHLSDESDGFVAHCMRISNVRLDHRWERLLHTLVFKLSPSDSKNTGWNIGEFDGWTDMMIIRDRGIIRHEKSETIPFGLQLHSINLWIIEINYWMSRWGHELLWSLFQALKEWQKHGAWYNAKQTALISFSSSTARIARGPRTA